MKNVVDGVLTHLKSEVVGLLDCTLTADEIGSTMKLSAELGLSSIDIVLLIESITATYGTQVDFLPWIERDGFEGLMDSTLLDIAEYVETSAESV